MSIRPDDYLQAAASLLGAARLEGEPCLRTSAGRAYYAAYLATLETVRRRTGRALRSIGHQALSRCLRNSGNPTAERIGHLLSELRDRREMADYKPDQTMSRLTSEAQLEDAREVFRLLPTLTGPLPPELVGTALPKPRTDSPVH